LISCSKKEDKNGIVDTSLRLSWITQSEFAGFFVAKEKGFYKNQKIKCDIYPGGVDLSSIKLVAAGSNTFGLAGADEILLARAKKIPLVAIAALHQKNPLCFISLKNSGIKSPKDFIGKRVGVKFGKPNEIIYRALIRKVGLNEELIEEVPVQFDMTPLFNGMVDVWPGYIANEPLVAKEKGYNLNIIYPSDYGIDLYANVIFTTEEIINKNQNLVENFLKASLEGWNWANNNRSATVDIILKNNDRLNKEHEKDMLDITLSMMKNEEGKGFGWMTDSKWRTIYEILRTQNIIEQNIDYSEAFTTKFLSKIYQTE